jgi:hypothetical protein
LQPAPTGAKPRTESPYKRGQIGEQVIDYILELLAQETLEEEDAELILAVMREHVTKAERKLEYIIQTFPNLMKSVFNFCGRVQDKEFIAEVLLKALRSKELQEYQLFWFGHILESHLMKTTKASDLINAIYNHSMATIISKAKILEISEGSDFQNLEIRFSRADNQIGFPGQRPLESAINHQQQETIG